MAATMGDDDMHASKIVASAAEAAAAATGMAAVATLLSGRRRAMEEVSRVTFVTSTATTTGTTVPLSPFEIFARASQSAKKIFDTPELLEAVMSCITDIATLFKLRRVSKTFKRTIHGSVKVKQRMFLQAHRRRPEQRLKDFAELNPLPKDPRLTPGPLKHFDFERCHVTGTSALLECDCATYYREWDWESIDSFLISADFQLNESDDEPAKQLWESMRIMNVAVALRIRFGDFIRDSLLDPFGEEIALPRDSTMGDLLRALCIYRDAVVRAYINTTRRRVANR
ncbi:hypothetical protein B0A48_00199 [Cryoendolithus antarcticus]|uniref:Uncharacterized protein n=1 Tax=Cryoendolithus antarcticus TaxID=1507870 RepID=A0A1V8TU11_9PEZI|nr:hypothetical protein B0A48_00199 [Cryoendolithus antarcticus]